MHRLLLKLQPFLLGIIAVLLLIIGYLVAEQAVTRPVPTAVARVPLPTLAAVIPTPPVTPPGALGGAPDGAASQPLSVGNVMAQDESANQPVDAPPTATVIQPTATITPTATLPPPTETPPPPTAAAEPPTPAPPEPAARVAVNGIPFESIVVMPPTVRQNAQAIFAAGQAVGRNPNSYSKVGDSTTEPPHFMARFDTGPYDLGDYVHLQGAINHFLGSHARDSLAGRIGMHAWTAVDPTWADKSVCGPNESPVACEIRVFNPSILLIRLGTNDVGVPALFDSSIRQIVATAIAAGVIPVIGTKADRHEGSNENNDILRRIAADYNIPLWDFDQVANTLPGRGLDVDAAHMNTFFAHDYRDPTAFQRGHSTHNLTALMMLDALWREIMGGG